MSNLGSVVCPFCASPAPLNQKGSGSVSASCSSPTCRAQLFLKTPAGVSQFLAKRAPPAQDNKAQPAQTSKGKGASWTDEFL